MNNINIQDYRKKLCTLLHSYHRSEYTVDVVQALREHIKNLSEQLDMHAKIDIDRYSWKDIYSEIYHDLHDVYSRLSPRSLLVCVEFNAPGALSYYVQKHQRIPGFQVRHLQREWNAVLYMNSKDIIKKAAPSMLEHYKTMLQNQRIECLDPTLLLLAMALSQQHINIHAEATIGYSTPNDQYQRILMIRDYFNQWRDELKIAYTHGRLKDINPCDFMDSINSIRSGNPHNHLYQHCLDQWKTLAASLYREDYRPLEELASWYNDNAITFSTMPEISSPITFMEYVFDIQFAEGIRAASTLFFESTLPLIQKILSENSTLEEEAIDFNVLDLERSLVN